MRGHGHDGARAVGDEDVVRDPNRDLAAVDGVDGGDAVQAHAGLLLVELRALKVGLAGGLALVGADLLDVADSVGVLLDEGVLRGDDHVGRAKERVRPRGVDAQFLRDLLDGKVQLRALGPADPVALLGLDLVDEVHVVQALEQLLRVVGDAQHPLGLDAAHDLAAAALALAADDLLVGQAHLAARAPVDGHLGLVGQAVLEELQEDPLRPLVVAGVRGVDLAVPVEAEAEHLELLAEVVDVLLGDNGGVDVVLDGVVLRRQAEGVPPDGEEHVVALQALLAADDVHGRVGARVADVQARARGIRELDQRVVLGLGEVVAGGEGLLLLPDLLPLLLDGGKVIGCVGHG